MFHLLLNPKKIHDLNLTSYKHTNNIPKQKYHFLKFHNLKDMHAVNQKSLGLQTHHFHLLI